MALFPVGYFPSVSASASGEAIEWTFERVFPEATGCRASVSAQSTQWHVFKIVGERMDGTTLSAAQIAAEGVDVGYAKKQVDGTFAEPTWLPLSSDAAQNAALPFAVDFKIFRARIGPDAQNGLNAGTYKTLVRAHFSEATRVLANLEVV